MGRTGRTALWIFAWALVARLAFGLWTDLTREPVEDEKGYVELAESVHDEFEFRLQRAMIAVPTIGPTGITFGRLARFSGNVLTSRVSTPERRSFRGPVAPLLFAPLAGHPAVFNRVNPGTGVTWVSYEVQAIRVLAILLGALGPPLLFLALRNSPLGERAWWPATAYALWPPAVYVSVRALSEAPSQALLLGGIACLALPRTKGGLLAGVLGALAVLARPAALIPAGLLVFATGTRRRATWFAIAFLVVLAPWEARNYLLHHRVLLTTNTGVTLVGGNSQAAADAEHPGKWRPPERVYAGVADPPDLGMWGWSSMSEEASDRRFTHDALTWIGEHPIAAARLCFWKVVRLFDPDPHSDKDDATSKAIVGWLTFAPALVLALLGATFWRRELPWTLLVLGTIATAVVFYGDTRMRTCADPAILVFAAHGLGRIARRRSSPS